MENYSLDPAWYYTSPGLSWDALLKHSKIILKLLIDVDMLLMFEKGIRGGISMISNRYGKANNKYMGEKLMIRKNRRNILFILFYLLYHKEDCERVATTAGGHLLWTLGT